MSEPWFEPKRPFSFRSLTWQGRAVITATYVVMTLAIIWGFFFADPETAAWWISGAVGLLAFVIGHTIVLWKMDWGYGRR